MSGKKKKASPSAEELERKMKKVKHKLNKYAKSEHNPKPEGVWGYVNLLSSDFQSDALSVIDHEEIVEDNIDRVSIVTETEEQVMFMSSSEGSPKGSIEVDSESEDGDGRAKKPEDKVTVITAENSSDVDKDLDETTRNILGIVPDLEQKQSVPVNKSIAKRWNYWLHKGLAKEDKENLLPTYKSKDKGCQLDAPELNPEILLSLPTADKTRDSHWAQTQSTLGAAMVALGNSMSMILEANGEIDEQRLLQQLSGSSKLLAETHFQLSTSRRAFMIPKLTNRKYKEVLENTEWDSMLFGDSLKKKLKSAKSLDEVGKEFLNQRRGQKPTSRSENGSSLSSNYQGPSGQAPRGRNSYRTLRFRGSRYANRSSSRPYNRSAPQSTSSKQRSTSYHQTTKQ